MSYQPLQYDGDGTVAAFPVTWPYIKEAHVLVDVDGQVASYSFTSPSQITFDTPPANGSKVTIQRKTPADELLATIAGRSVLKSSELNLVYTQLLYIMQEVFAVGEALEGSTIEVVNALNQIQGILTQVEDLRDEVNVVAGGIAYQYDAVVSIPFSPTNGQALAVIPMVRDVTFPANAAGSEGYALTTPSGSDFTASLRKNGVEFGTVTFADGQNVPTWSVAVDTDFSADDRLTLVVTNPNSSIRDFGITMKLQRRGSTA